MSDDTKLLVVGWALLAVVLITLMSLAFASMVRWQPHDAALRQQCIGAGGIWLEDSNAICVWSLRGADEQH